MFNINIGQLTVQISLDISDLSKGHNIAALFRPSHIYQMFFNTFTCKKKIEITYVSQKDFLSLEGNQYN